jgi:glycosyltransferase involved in cell wall biosynthesis
VSPLKVLDYLFCGRPTVIARIPAVENLIGQFPSLLPFAAGDPASLAEALLRMRRDGRAYLELARLDSRRARETCSWERIAETIATGCFGEPESPREAGPGDGP